MGLHDNPVEEEYYRARFGTCKTKPDTKTVYERLEAYIRKSGLMLPEIRYFDGNERFSTITGNYSSKTLEGSIDLFLKTRGY